MSSGVRLDLNNPEFQSDLFALQKPEQLAVLATLRKIASLSWDQVHRDQGSSPQLASIERWTFLL